MSDNGLIIVFTGDGKGKTTAALGVALRAVGHRMYVSVVQFLKSSLATGEARAAERLAPELEFVSLGRGFVNCCGSTTPLAEHRKAAGEALTLARQRRRRLEQRELEVGTDHRGRLEQLDGVVTEPVEPPADPPPDALRHPPAPRSARVAVPAHHPAAPPPSAATLAAST